MDLNNKTALVTGAGRGIGQAIAIEFARSGADVIGVDLKHEDLAKTKQAVAQHGRRFIGFACDIGVESQVRELMSKAAAEGGFDFLINNAGVMASGPFADADFAVWRKTIEINLLGLMLVTHVALPELRKRGGGHIVNIASIAGKFGTEGVAAYAASKHCVVGLSSALRAELRHSNIKVSWICPSIADTEMARGVRRHFLTPLVDPQDIARSVRRAIETNASEVFVPRIVRFNVSILPSLAPNLARFISRVTGASRGWLVARKEGKSRG